MSEVSETTLKNDLVEVLTNQLQGCVAARLEDQQRVGLPDIFVAWRGLTTWIEAKYANPDYKSRRIQSWRTLELAHAAKAFYVIYAVRKKEQRTFIVHPEVVLHKAWHFDLPGYTAGFDHEAVVKRIRETHDYY